MKNKYFVFWLTVMILGALTALNDAADFPIIINQTTQFFHHWIIGLIVAVIAIWQIWK